MIETVMASETRYIHIQWRGPYSLDSVLSANNEQDDIGLYQVYGTHPLYGARALLYIGKCDKQNFRKRFQQHKYWLEGSSNSGSYLIHLGRLATYDKTPSIEQWQDDIRAAEKLLVYSHAPTANSSGLNAEFDEKYYNVHLLNWNDFGQLLPEVSGARYSSRFWSDEGFHSFTHTDRPK